MKAFAMLAVTMLVLPLRSCAIFVKGLLAPPSSRILASFLTARLIIRYYSVPPPHHDSTHHCIINNPALGLAIKRRKRRRPQAWRDPLETPMPFLLADIPSLDLDRGEPGSSTGLWLGDFERGFDLPLTLGGQNLNFPRPVNRT